MKISRANESVPNDVCRGIIKQMIQKHTEVSVFNSEGPPVPIPNTEVKLVCADNTRLEATREDRSMLTPREVHLGLPLYEFLISFI